MNRQLKRIMESEPFRRTQTRIMLHLFARALDVEAPRCPNTSTDALKVFAVFTMNCAQAATSHGFESANPLRNELYREALKCGQVIRALPIVRKLDALELVQVLYRNIGIRLDGTLPGEIRIAPCYFSRYYTPRECWFMSGFDQGIIEGITGTGTLAFASCITEGAPCCRATFS